MVISLCANKQVLLLLEMYIIDFIVSPLGATEECDREEHVDQDFILKLRVDMDMVHEQIDIEEALLEVYYDRRKLSKYKFITEV